MFSHTVITFKDKLIALKEKEIESKTESVILIKEGYTLAVKRNAVHVARHDVPLRNDLLPEALTAADVRNNALCYGTRGSVHLVLNGSLRSQRLACSSVTQVALSLRARYVCVLLDNTTVQLLSSELAPLYSLAAAEGSRFLVTMEHEEWASLVLCVESRILFYRLSTGVAYAELSFCGTVSCFTMDVTQRRVYACIGKKLLTRSLVGEEGTETELEFIPKSIALSTCEREVVVASEECVARCSIEGEVLWSRRYEGITGVFEVEDIERI